MTRLLKLLAKGDPESIEAARKHCMEAAAEIIDAHEQQIEKLKQENARLKQELNQWGKN